MPHTNLVETKSKQGGTAILPSDKIFLQEEIRILAATAITGAVFTLHLLLAEKQSFYTNEIKRKLIYHQFRSFSFVFSLYYYYPLLLFVCKSSGKLLSYMNSHQ